jgi:hypothetical protein
VRAKQVVWRGLGKKGGCRGRLVLFTSSEAKWGATDTIRSCHVSAVSQVLLTGHSGENGAAKNRVGFNQIKSNQIKSTDMTNNV